MVASLISLGMAWIAATNRIMPNPRTFQTTDPMIDQVERSASTPRNWIGLSMSPRSISALLMSPNVGSNSQTHRRLDTPRPMTTGTKMIARVVRRSGVFGATSKARR